MFEIPVGFWKKASEFPGVVVFRASGRNHFEARQAYGIKDVVISLTRFPAEKESVCVAYHFVPRGGSTTRDDPQNKVRHNLEDDNFNYFFRRPVREGGESGAFQLRPDDENVRKFLALMRAIHRRFALHPPGRGRERGRMDAMQKKIREKYGS